MKNRSDVFFPCIHFGHEGVVNKITCFVNEDVRGLVKSIGLDDASVEKVIVASRNHENSKEAANSIFVRIENPNFQGRSYELALAVADKLSRYNRYDDSKKYFATGIVESDGRGKISSIENINEKLRLISSIISDNNVIFIPKDNIDGQDEEQKKLLSIIGEKKVSIFAIENTKEINSSLGSINDLINQKKISIIHYKHFVFFVLSSLILVGYLSFSRSETQPGEPVLEKKETIYIEKKPVQPVEIPTGNY